MPLKVRRAFVQAVKAFPDVEFIWKYEEPEDGKVEKLPNLHLETWLPQIDIFAQKKLLGFVTHSGTNSITEATYFGVPLVS